MLSLSDISSLKNRNTEPSVSPLFTALCNFLSGMFFITKETKSRRHKVLSQNGLFAGAFTVNLGEAAIEY